MDRPSASLDLAALRARLGDETGLRLWRSLEEIADTPEARRFLEAEFPDVVAAGTIDRRTWMRLMGASLALAGLAACDRNQVVENGPLLSQSRNTPGHTPGVPLTFATTLERDGTGCGALVKVQEGRPIKVEGNPLHPASLGATDPVLQAEVLSLYDPNRSRMPTESGVERSWDALQAFLRPLRNQLVIEEGRGLHVLLPPVASPTLDRLTGVVRQLMPQARWHAFAPILEDHRRAGARLAFGRPVDLVFDLREADIVVCIGGDLFASEPGHIRYAADYQARRRMQERPLPRLVAVESSPSLVGARADERIVVRPREVEASVQALAGALGVGSPAPTGVHPAMERVGELLRAAGPRGLVAVGREQAPTVHALAHAINERLGAFGRTVRAIEPVAPTGDAIASITALAEASASGQVSHLLILGGNPAYDAPADLDFPDLIRRVPVSVHLGLTHDETAACCRWHVPRCHPFEAFGDLRAFDGTVGFRQPATARLVPSLSAEEMLGLLSGQGTEGRELLALTWREAWGERFDEHFARALEDGVVPDTAFQPLPVRLRPEARAVAPGTPAAGPLDIAFAPDPSVWDGRFANNGWLQELPKPLSKQVWGNAALIGPETADRMQLRTGDVVEITSTGRSLAAPVWVLPGQAADTLTLPLGYGRTRAGALGNGVGFDAYRLRTTANPWLASGDLRRTDRREALITTQQHHALHGRDLVRVVTQDPPRAPVQDQEPQPSLYSEWSYEGHAWGMAIDLDACIGCNACVVACQAENNVAVVGPEEVARGREMHWLRIDRYFAGDPATPRTYFQPVLCMHCEKAPCEVVCPVNATVHSSEGLNDMVYNRCIGTRTCSNNCPYKVRRFNFLDNRTTDYAPDDEALNPQVTVRSRGVMEKCTYCVQRIGAARVAARLEERPVREGEVVTACQQACPTQAIVFGDLNDEGSAVARLRRSPRTYALLGELNTQPRTTYLARIEPGEEPPSGPGGTDRG